MGVGLAFMFVPLATVAFAFMPRELTGDATGLFNLMRNLGGSFGIAAVTTILARQAQFHQARLVEHVTPYNPNVQQMLSKATAQLVAAGQSHVNAQKQVLGITYMNVVKQATLMSFIDCFRILGIAMIVLIPVVFIMRRPPRHHGPAPDMH